MLIYVASSWRNDIQPIAVEYLRERDFEVYDFRNPGPDNYGFHWSNIDPNWKSWTPGEYINNLNHPIAQAGYDLDWNAMEKSDGCLLINECGKSAHLEAGYFIGARKPCVILIRNGDPELMYKMATAVVTGLSDAVKHLRAAESELRNAYLQPLTHKVQNG